MAFPACHSVPTLSITRCPVGPHNSITARDFRHALRKPNQSTTTIPLRIPMVLRAILLRNQQPFMFPAAKLPEIATPCRDGFSRDSEGQEYSQPQSPVFKKQCSGKEQCSGQGQLSSHVIPLDRGRYPRGAPKIIRTYSKKKKTLRLHSMENQLTPPSCLTALDYGIDQGDPKLMRKKKRRKLAPVNELALVRSWRGPSPNNEINDSNVDALGPADDQIELAIQESPSVKKPTSTQTSHARKLFGSVKRNPKMPATDSEERFRFPTHPPVSSTRKIFSEWNLDSGFEGVENDSNNKCIKPLRRKRKRTNIKPLGLTAKPQS